MKICLLLPQGRLSPWVEAGIQDFSRRLPRHWQFQLKPYRHRGFNGAALKEEINRQLEGTLAVYLDEQGQQLATSGWVSAFEQWHMHGKDVSFVIGPPEGWPSALTPQPLSWSLSQLTWPHQVAALLVVEQLYRVSTVLAHHPYHR